MVDLKYTCTVPVRKRGSEVKEPTYTRKRCLRRRSMTLFGFVDKVPVVTNSKQ